MTDLIPKVDVKAHWMARLSDFLPGFLGQHDVLSRLQRGASLVLYGSTTMGIDDEGSDLDVWLLLSEEDLAKLDAVSETRFFVFELDGKAGHLTAHTIDELLGKVRNCDMDTICHLRSAVTIADYLDGASELIRLAQLPMRKEVSDAYFFHHYVEMRSEHRACDNPIERIMPVALLCFLPKTMAHALRAAMILDGEPYPYDKWLYNAARQTPTGRALAPAVEAIINHLAEDQLRRGGPECDNPIGQALMTIRHILIDAAHAKGNRSPWLTEWWLYMNQARDAIQGIQWE